MCRYKREIEKIQEEINHVIIGKEEVVEKVLPKSQLDRFMIKLSMGYSSVKQEVEMLKGHHKGHPLEEVKPVINGARLLQIGNRFCLS